MQEDGILNFLFGPIVEVLDDPIGLASTAAEEVRERVRVCVCVCIEAEREGCSSIESTAFYSVIILLQLDDKLRVVPSRNFSRAWVRDRMFIK